VRTRKVMVLVTGAALNRIQPLPIWSAPHLHRVLMAVVSLAREVSRGVAIHAARMAQHRNDGLKSSSTSLARSGCHSSLFDVLGLRSGFPCQQQSGQRVGCLSHIHALAEP
jgi:hypothetical protein